MPAPIRIIIGEEVYEAELNDTGTARRLAAALPVEAAVARWGGEAYCMTGVDADPGDPTREVLEAGELAFWPAGRAFCIFWGPTPASQGTEPRAVSPVVPIGRILGGLERLNRTCATQTLRIERADAAGVPGGRRPDA